MLDFVDSTDFFIGIIFAHAQLPIVIHQPLAWLTATFLPEWHPSFLIDVTFFTYLHTKSRLQILKWRVAKSSTPLGAAFRREVRPTPARHILLLACILIRSVCIIYNRLTSSKYEMGSFPLPGYGVLWIRTVTRMLVLDIYATLKLYLKYRR